MSRLNSNIILQSVEVKNAIESFQFDPVLDKDQYADLNMNLESKDLDSNGLPKADLSGKQMIPTMNIPFVTTSIYFAPLKDGRFFIPKEVVRHLWEYMLRPHDGGGLKIDDGKGGTRSIKSDGSDFVPVDESFNEVIFAQKKQAD